MKYKITKIATDAIHNVTVNGYYNSDNIQIGGIVVFQFDLDETPHNTKAEFLTAVKERIENNQPVISEEEQAEITLAEQAKTLLDEYVGNNITLNPIE